MDFQAEIDRLVPLLEAGKTLLYPTATIWGIGCDAFNEAAVEQVFKLKNRPKEKRLILLVADEAQLKEYVPFIPLKASNLIAYHMRPLTIIYDQTQGIPAYLLEEDLSVAIRITKDPFCKALLQAFGRPITSTSANISGQPFPTSFATVDPAIVKGVDAVAQHRQEEETNNTPSTIVRIGKNNDLIVLRN